MGKCSTGLKSVFELDTRSATCSVLPDPGLDPCVVIMLVYDVCVSAPLVIY